MHPQLQAILDDYRSASDRLHRLVDGLDEDRWRARPGRGGWSAAECIAHLNIAAEKYLPEMERAMTEVHRLPNHPGEYRLGAFGRLFRALVGPLPRLLGRRRFGVPTTEPFTPSGELPMASTVAEYDRLYGLLEAHLEAADGFSIDQVKFPSPFDSRVKVSVFLAHTILPRHAHRHLQQAEEAVAVAGSAGR